MALLYYDPQFLQHDTGDHPESAARIIPAARQLNLIAMHFGCIRPSWEPLAPHRLTRIHSREYVEAVRNLAEGGGGVLEHDTVLSKRSFDVASAAAGAVCDAVDKVIAGEERHAFCLIRPPGHHASHDKGRGFCIFNNVALAALMAIDQHDLDRVLIVDWDVHHGDGTQEIFWEDGRVGFLSIHRYPFYPGTGAADEMGSGAGLGTKLNVPIPFGTSRTEYLQRFNSGLNSLASRIRPQLIIVSSGFDAHRLDPVGSLGLESEDFALMTRSVLDIANTYSDGKVVSALEGGYNPGAVAECVEKHVQELMATD
jgi:acetoin utilization deacetylase AcuC-like enzyme